MAICKSIRLKGIREMKEIESNSIFGMGEFADELVPQTGFRRSPIFRGQRSVEWSIQPRLLREKIKKTEFKNWRNLEAAQLMKFKQRSADELVREPHSELEWRAQAAHKGLPTALSSWTEDATVALWFATAPTKEESDGVVWQLLPGDTSLEIDHDHEQVPERPAIYRPRHRDDAMRNQRVCFLSHPLPEEACDPVPFEDYFRFSKKERMHLYQIRIPHEAKADLRAKLAVMGKDAHFLFPGLGGLCGQIQDEMYSHTDSYEWVFKEAA